MNENYGGGIVGGCSSILCAILSWYFGNIDGPFKVLLAFVIVDYLLGTAGAAIEHKLNATEGFRWTSRKIIIFILVGIAHVIGREIFGNALLLRDTVIYFYIANEGMSIIENADRAKVPIPDALKKFFEKLKDKDKKENEKVDD